MSTLQTVNVDAILSPPQQTHTHGNKFLPASIQHVVPPVIGTESSGDDSETSRKKKKTKSKRSTKDEKRKTYSQSKSKSVYNQAKSTIAFALTGAHLNPNHIDPDLTHNSQTKTSSASYYDVRDDITESDSNTMTSGQALPKKARRKKLLNLVPSPPSTAHSPPLPTNKSKKSTKRPSSDLTLSSSDPAPESRSRYLPATLTTKRSKLQYTASHPNSPPFQSITTTTISTADSNYADNNTLSSNALPHDTPPLDNELVEYPTRQACVCCFGPTTLDYCEQPQNGDADDSDNETPNVGPCSVRCSWVEITHRVRKYVQVGRWIYSHPYLRVLCACLTLILNILMFSEDPQSYSNVPVSIPGIGLAVNFVWRGYPDARMNAKWLALKIALLISFPVVGILIGEYLIRRLLLQQICNLRGFKRHKGILAMGFSSFCLSIIAAAQAYNLLVTHRASPYLSFMMSANNPSTTPLDLNGGAKSATLDLDSTYTMSIMPISNSTFSVLALYVAFLGDCYAVFAIIDSILQDRYNYSGCCPRVKRRCWPRVRVPVFWLYLILCVSSVLAHANFVLIHGGGHLYWQGSYVRAPTQGSASNASLEETFFSAKPPFHPPSPPTDDLTPHLSSSTPPSPSASPTSTNITPPTVLMGRELNLPLLVTLCEHVQSSTSAIKVCDLVRVHFSIPCGFDDVHNHSFAFNVPELGQSQSASDDTRTRANNTNTMRPHSSDDAAAAPSTDRGQLSDYWALLSYFSAKTRARTEQSSQLPWTSAQRSTWYVNYLEVSHNGYKNNGLSQDTLGLEDLAHSVDLNNTLDDLVQFLSLASKDSMCRDLPHYFYRSSTELSIFEHPELGTPPTGTNPSNVIWLDPQDATFAEYTPTWEKGLQSSSTSPSSHTTTSSNQGPSTNANNIMLEARQASTIPHNVQNQAEHAETVLPLSKAHTFMTALLKLRITWFPSRGIWGLSEIGRVQLAALILVMGFVLVSQELSYPHYDYEEDAYARLVTRPTAAYFRKREKHKSKRARGANKNNVQGTQVDSNNPTKNAHSAAFGSTTGAIDSEPESTSRWGALCTINGDYEFKKPSHTNIPGLYSASIQMPTCQSLRARLASVTNWFTRPVCMVQFFLFSCNMSAHQITQVLRVVRVNNPLFRALACMKHCGDYLCNTLCFWNWTFRTRTGTTSRSTFDESYDNDHNWATSSNSSDTSSIGLDDFDDDDDDGGIEKYPRGGSRNDDDDDDVIIVHLCSLCTTIGDCCHDPSSEDEWNHAHGTASGHNSSDDDAQNTFSNIVTDQTTSDIALNGFTNLDHIYLSSTTSTTINDPQWSTTSSRLNLRPSRGTISPKHPSASSTQDAKTSHAPPHKNSKLSDDFITARWLVYSVLIGVAMFDCINLYSQIVYTPSSYGQIIDQDGVIYPLTDNNQAYLPSLDSAFVSYYHEAHNQDRANLSSTTRPNLLFTNGVLDDDRQFVYDVLHHMCPDHSTYLHQTRNNANNTAPSYTADLFAAFGFLPPNEVPYESAIMASSVTLNQFYNSYRPIIITPNSRTAPVSDQEPNSHIKDPPSSVSVANININDPAIGIDYISSNNTSGRPCSLDKLSETTSQRPPFNVAANGAYFNRTTSLLTSFQWTHHQFLALAPQPIDRDTHIASNGGSFAGDVHLFTGTRCACFRVFSLKSMALYTSIGRTAPLFDVPLEIPLASSQSAAVTSCYYDLDHERVTDLTLEQAVIDEVAVVRDLLDSNTNKLDNMNDEDRDTLRDAKAQTYARARVLHDVPKAEMSTHKGDVFLDSDGKIKHALCDRMETHTIQLTHEEYLVLFTGASMYTSGGVDKKIYSMRDSAPGEPPSARSLTLLNNMNHLVWFYADSDLHSVADIDFRCASCTMPNDRLQRSLTTIDGTKLTPHGWSFLEEEEEGEVSPANTRPSLIDVTFSASQRVLRYAGLVQFMVPHPPNTTLDDDRHTSISVAGLFFDHRESPSCADISPTADSLSEENSTNTGPATITAISDDPFLRPLLYIHEYSCMTTAGKLNLRYIGANFMQKLILCFPAFLFVLIIIIQITVDHIFRSLLKWANKHNHRTSIDSDPSSSSKIFWIKAKILSACLFLYGVPPHKSTYTIRSTHTTNSAKYLNL